MRKNDALRLKPGDRVLVEGRFTGETYTAAVVRVTQKGGVLIKGSGGGTAWVPYSRVHWADQLMRRVSAAQFR